MGQPASSFGFENILFTNSKCTISNISPNSDYNIDFSDLSGLIDEEHKKFSLRMTIVVENKDKTVQIEVSATSLFAFEESEHLGKFFYVNAPAIAFPYYRAYISTLSGLSGITNINIPTINLISLKDQLEQNTTTAI